MRTSRRPAVLALTASAALVLGACSSAVDGIPSAAPTSSSVVATDQPAENPADVPVGDESSDDGLDDAVEDGELPEPGAGIPGDEGLCQAVAGWYAFAGLVLLSSDDEGNVDPGEYLPLLEALQAAPDAHQDAAADLLDAADAVTAAAAESAAAVESGTDAVTAYDLMTAPITAFADSCTAAGVSV